ncbi:hypothetical protein [Haloimpatiens massiliensis]|nr:hypothetical protein [Haloimpatiens massiliensis]
MIKKKTIIEDELSNEKSLVKLYGKLQILKAMLYQALTLRF